jgi:hypothetical protein
MHVIDNTAEQANQSERLSCLKSIQAEISNQWATGRLKIKATGSWSSVVGQEQKIIMDALKSAALDNCHAFKVYRASDNTLNFSLAEPLHILVRTVDKPRLSLECAVAARNEYGDFTVTDNWPWGL